MEWYLAVGAGVFCAGCAFLAALCMRAASVAAQKATEMAYAAEEDAVATDSLRRRAASVGAAVSNFSAEAKADAERASQKSDECHGYSLLAVDQANYAAECADAVKAEVEKVRALIERLQKDRAEHPPLLAFTYDPSGERCESVILDGAECPNGRPFSFSPAQVQPEVSQ